MSHPRLLRAAEARLARNRDELAPERAIWRRARVAPDHVSRHCSAAGGAGDSAVLPATRRTTRTVYRPGFEAAQRKLGRDVADALCKVEIPDDHHRLAPAASLGAAVAAPALPAPHRDVEIFVGCNWEGGKFADSAPRSDASSGSGNATTLDAPGAAIVPGTPSVLDAARDASRREAKWQEHLEALRQEAGSSDSEPDSAVDKPSGQGAFAQHMEAREELLPAGKAYRLAMHSTAAQPRRVWCPCLRC